ncbi:hypothetical protein [Leptolyngbya sp. 7M]|uniref:hypothetical protein n=1 Tax=Leptolyngbya sp. 7M TaxID=2812896 RepID=UPI001B8C735B|nr:hypothetical protein [Leptolyngbya sp. 7M]QYO65209.1 hypothetical protein JVX88_00030 [Leptolyngbya sp. 7M]
MNEPFDNDPDLDLDEDKWADEFAAFEDFDTENDNVRLRTAILQKENMVALLCIKSAPVGAAICRVDPREPLPAVQLYDDPHAALHWFTRSLRTSKVNGWNVVYDGLPLEG